MPVTALHRPGARRPGPKLGRPGWTARFQLVPIPFYITIRFQSGSFIKPLKQVNNNDPFQLTNF